MTLTVFDPFNEIPLEATVDWPLETFWPEASALAGGQSPIKKLEYSAVAKPAATAASSQHLAQELEYCRQQLLSLLQENTCTHQMVTELLANSIPVNIDTPSGFDSKSLASNLVQSSDFVQLDTPLFAGNFEQSTHELVTESQLGCLGFANTRIFPSSLLQITDKFLELSKQTPVAEPTFIFKLIKSRRHLQTIRQKMIVANTGLVAFIANKHKTNFLSFEDLMQEGTIGLIKAVERFDPNRGICFSTYAVFWIKQAISRHIVKQEKVVRLPVALAEKASIVFEVMRNCYLEHNRWPSLAEIEVQCTLTVEEIKTVSSYYQATHSLDAPLFEENDEQTLMENLKQQQFASPLNDLIDRNFSAYLGNLVAKLPEKEATILNMRFGLKNHTEMTLQAIADQLHLTRERVRQIQNEALKKLKQQFACELLPFLEPNDS